MVLYQVFLLAIHSHFYSFRTGCTRIHGRALLKQCLGNRQHMRADSYWSMPQLGNAGLILDLTLPDPDAGMPMPTDAVD